MGGLGVWEDLQAFVLYGFRVVFGGDVAAGESKEARNERIFYAYG